MKELHVLVKQLDVGFNGDSTLYRLEIGWCLRFRLGPSLFGKRPVIWTNHPATEHDEFCRENFRPLYWSNDSHKLDPAGEFSDVPIIKSGSFRFYVTILSEADSVLSGYFIVDPVLLVGSNSGDRFRLSLNSLMCQTYISKNLGPLSTWHSKLRVSQKTGYNMIHFTPLQALGGSGSAYSISDQEFVNSSFSDSGSDVSIPTWNDISLVMKSLREVDHILTISDIVLNHTSNESPWLKSHTEASYNCLNSPHLRPAYMLDYALLRLSDDIGRGVWNVDFPVAQINCEAHLETVKRLIYDHYLPKIRIHEFFVVDVEAIIEEFSTLEAHDVVHDDFAPLKLIPDFSGRYKARIDFDIALKRHFDLDINALRQTLLELNRAMEAEVWSHIHIAVDNVIKAARWQRLADDGPHLVACNWANPIAVPYFTHPTMELAWEDTPCSSSMMAHNGWVMGDDPLKNFAGPDSNVYLRRELIAWGDSVKLRYGEAPSDSPFLWSYISSYVKQVASIFDGIRLDNCHSTPLHVAEYMLDTARRVNPNLYVVAELFTSSESADNIFINRLGINSLIREALSAWDSHELGRLVHRYGGALPVGSFQSLHQHVMPLRPSMSHALFMDVTHDNPSIFERRTNMDPLPITALVSMARCATGSTRGADELVAEHISVVTETRTYGVWNDLVKKGPMGIIPVKSILNQLHFQLEIDGYTETFVDQMNSHVVAVTRHDPQTHKSVVLVAHTLFDANTEIPPLKCLKVEGSLDMISLEARMVTTNENFSDESNFIRGTPTVSVEFRQNVAIDDSSMFNGHFGSSLNELDWTNFGPGCIIILNFSLHPDQQEALKNIRLSECRPEWGSILDALTLADLNVILFRCENEERDETNGQDGVYVIPGSLDRPLTYAGLQGFQTVLADIALRNDVGHCLASHLRNGDWPMDYIVGRLRRFSSTHLFGLADCLEKQFFVHLKKLPRFLIPKYFHRILDGLYVSLLGVAWSKMSLFIRSGSPFVKALALGSIQHAAVISSAPLPDINVPSVMSNVTLAAGLPYFSTGYMRNWGRDTFISLRGLFLLTGRFDEAAGLILAYGGCLRHGLIPNLLDGGLNARFNCRDAIWWWLHSIMEFVKMNGGDSSILKTKIRMLFQPHSITLEDVIHQALQVHFGGLKFRECANAIDEHMVEAGFNNVIGTCKETGFVYGGNLDNCGTWMDKMGSSEKAGTKGKPATPRDGSAIELVALSYVCIRWLAAIHSKGEFSYAGVTNEEGLCWTWDEWSAKIFNNFEKKFYVPSESESLLDDFDVEHNLINVRGIYKDTYGAGWPWADYQFRCNFVVAMAIAPDLFANKKRCWTSLKLVRDRLLGPIGMATLDSSDWAYRGYYDNSNDSDDPRVAQGINYHQGPEWVWPVGFFLKAYLYFGEEMDLLAEAIDFVREKLGIFYSLLISDNPWKGIPELTNRNGTFCPDSNPIQAWSMAAILEAVYQLILCENSLN